MKVRAKVRVRVIVNERVSIRVNFSCLFESSCKLVLHTYTNTQEISINQDCIPVVLKERLLELLLLDVQQVVLLLAILHRYINIFKLLWCDVFGYYFNSLISCYEQYYIYTTSKTKSNACNN